MFQNNQPLTQSTLQSFAPSIFAEKAWDGVSGKYSFLSTAQVVGALAERNILPFSARQSYTRIEGKHGYTKHTLRFRPASNLVTIAEPRALGSVHPEIVLTNSHDRASSFIIELGLFRLVCSNGMVVSAGSFESYRVRHVGATIGDVLDATYSIIDQFPMLTERVKQYQSIMLTQEQREHYAALAMGLRWDADKVPFASARLLSTRRESDRSTDLWTTYNVVQENLIRGQRRAYTRLGPFSAGQRVAATREVKSIDTDLDINRGLWKLTESFATA